MKLSRLNMNTKCYSTCHDVTLSILNHSFYFLAVVVCDPPYVRMVFVLQMTRATVLLDTKGNNAVML